jgi:hypothetical protein
MMQHYAVQSVALSEAKRVPGYPISGHLNGTALAPFYCFPVTQASSEVTGNQAGTTLVQSVDPERSPAPAGLPAASFDTAWLFGAQVGTIFGRATFYATDQVSARRGHMSGGELVHPYVTRLRVKFQPGAGIWYGERLFDAESYARYSRSRM